MARQRAPTAFTVMTWNVENLFRPGMGDGPADEETYRRKIAYLAKVISGVGPDLVALQEIGDPSAATDLAAAVGAGWKARLSSQPDGRGIRVHAEGEDRQVSSRILVDAVLELLPQDGAGTLVAVAGGYEVSGKVATMGAGMIRQKATKILDEFFARAA